jgi:hypothetical protein
MDVEAIVNVARTSVNEVVGVRRQRVRILATGSDLRVAEGKFGYDFMREPSRTKTNPAASSATVAATGIWAVFSSSTEA